MLGAVRSVARAGRSAGPQARRMATDVIAQMEKEAAHAEKETAKWRVVAFACLPVCAGLAFLTLKNAHPHHRTSPDYPFLMYKVKDFPWGPDPLFGIPK
ncbi:hypothetical protein D9Q98_009761 [Chlorella vulgaris]|uniref:Uncharacterized protein n=1 Tax=Chlorella vulgaris TaxID=3077 RepID=A0A9D4TEY6_CHLVU|nr:hypothetical protein D9Q98_009761 [Chlorella vulgaris]